MSELARALEATGEGRYADTLRDLAPRDAEDARAIGRALRGLSSRIQPPRQVAAWVGSETFSLFGETTADLAPLEVYTLHCCRELKWNDDPRAPSEDSVEAGMLILRRYNEADEIAGEPK